MKLREEIYNRNIMAIEKYRGDLYLALQKEQSLEESECDVMMEQAKDGSKILCLKKGEKNYYMNSKYAPTKEAKIWAEKYEIKNVNQITIVFGFGNGMFIQALLEKISKNNIVVVYEPSAKIFEKVLNEIEIEELVKNRQLRIVINGINEQKLKEIIHNVVDISNFGDQNCLILPRYAEVFPVIYDKFLRTIKTIEENIYVSQLTKICLSKEAMKNSIKNVKYLLESKSFHNAKESMPSNLNAILVSAGPSLMSEIENLKKAKGKILIVAVERIVDLLLDNGIVPDILASVDPIKAAPSSKKIQEANMTFLTIPTCNPELYELHKGNKIICNNGSLYHSICGALQETQDIIPTGGSVATFAFSALINLGVKRIVLVGQDLAFQDGKSHAGTVQEEDPWGLKIEAEGVDGNKVITRQDWKMFADDFESQIAEHPDIEYIDTKKTGLKIKGTVQMGLGKVLEKYCKEEKPIQDWLGHLQDVFPMEKRTKVLDLFKEYLKELKRIKKISKDAIELCDKLKKKEQQDVEGDIAHFEEKMQKLIVELEGKHAMVLIGDILYGRTNEMQAKIARLETDEDIWEETKEVFQVTIDVSKEMEKDLKKIMKELEEYFGGIQKSE